MSRDPSKSRPLSANVKRMMWLERAAPENSKVLNAQRTFTDKDKMLSNFHTATIQNAQLSI